MPEQVLEFRRAEVRQETPRPRPTWFLRTLRAALSDYLILLLTLGYFLAVVAYDPDYASVGNLRDVFAAMLPLLAVAVGQTLVVITGGIDLSVGSVISLASVLGAMLMTKNAGLLANHPTPAVPVAIVTMLAAGAVVGLFNGAAVTLLRMPPFIVTLTTMMFVAGLAVWTTQSRNVAGLPASFIRIDHDSVTGATTPYAVLIVGGLAVAAQAMLRGTLAGRWLYAVGANARAAEISGVPVRATTIFAYAASGFCAAAAAVLYTARLETGSPSLGEGKLLDVVGAVVIGGTSLFGGKGSAAKTVCGVAFFALIGSTLTWFNLGHAATAMVKGGVILLAASLDLLRVKVLARR